MDYGKLFTRAWGIIWGNKFLIALGILVVLGSAGGTGGTQSSISNMSGGRSEVGPPQFDFTAPFKNLSLGGLEIALVLFIGSIMLVVLVGLWILSAIARGALIHGAYAVDDVGSSSFSDAFSAAWQKGWRLIGIGLLPAIPTALLLLVAVVSLVGYTSIETFDGGSAWGVPRSLTAAPILALVCFFGLASLVLALLRTFANRACMLEDLGVFASYKRGFEVLTDNFGAALVLFILQLALGLVIGVFLFLPGILIALCCLLWPLLLVVQGAFSAYYSTLWTLAWAQWTGVPGVIESQPA